MNMLRGTRIISRHKMRLVAKPEAVFPLLCPEKELEWIDGWEYEMIYSSSGFAERGCTFRTNLPPEGEAIWFMTRHAPPYEAEYVRFAAGLAITCLNIRLADVECGTVADVTFTFTGLTERGNDYLAEHAAIQSENAVNRMERALNHFLQTGEKLHTAFF